MAKKKKTQEESAVEETVITKEEDPKFGFKFMQLRKNKIFNIK